MKYAIYFTYKGGTEETFDVYDAKTRDWNINEMTARKGFTNISYCKVYTNGEHGERKEIAK